MLNKIAITLLILLLFGWLMMLVTVPIIATLVAIIFLAIVAIRTLVAVWKEYLDDLY